MDRPHVALVVVALATCVGCEGGNDDRLANLAEKVVDEQSQQNQKVSQAHASLAEGSQQLVQADADARRDLAALQDKLRQDQADVGRQRDALEAERRIINLERKQESLIGSSLLTFGILLAAMAPLILAGFALATLSRGSTQEEIAEVLIEELVEALGQGRPEDLGRLPVPQAHPRRLPLPVGPR